MKGDQLLQQLLSHGEKEGVVGGAVPLTRPYHLAVTNEAPEFGGRVHLFPFSQAQLGGRRYMQSNYSTEFHKDMNCMGNTLQANLYIILVF